MIVVMNPRATQANIDQVTAKIEQAGLRTHLSQGEDRFIIGVVGDKKLIAGLEMNMMDGVEKTVRITEKYKLVSRDFHPANSIVDVAGFPVGGEQLAIMAGPCSVESEEQIIFVAQSVKAAGATVIWRCHAGAEGAGEAADYAWAFLDRYLEDVDLVIVSRPEYRPPYIEAERCAVLAPSIDADSPKNRVLDLDEAWSVVRLSGIFAGEPPFEAVPFMRHDGRADAFRGLADDPVLAGGPVPLGARVVTQVNRWDRLKGGLELVEAFAENIAVLPEDAHLLLVGPTPDGPESQATLTQIVERCSVLPESVASRIHVAAVSMEDREVNATVVNAVQRVSSVVTQRSLIEAFGLTVAEAMWKKAPVVASAVGGIRDQIDDGVDGVLVDPADGLAWAEAVRDLLLFPERAQEMGLAAHESVRREFLSNRHLQDLLQIVADLVG